MPTEHAAAGHLVVKMVVAGPASDTLQNWHGAAIGTNHLKFSYRALGLREILKAHGSGYGRILGQSLQVNHSRNQRMLEDLAVRLVRECLY